jgi:hypothetical protein
MYEVWPNIKVKRRRGGLGEYANNDADGLCLS